MNDENLSYLCLKKKQSRMRRLLKSTRNAVDGSGFDVDGKSLNEKNLESLSGELLG